MVIVLKYTVMRLALFVGCLALVAVLGARGILALALALGISFGLSYVLLGQQREQVTAAVATRVDARLAAQDHVRMMAAKEREQTAGSQFDLGAPTPVNGVTIPDIPDTRS